MNRVQTPIHTPVSTADKFIQQHHEHAGPLHDFSWEMAAEDGKKSPSNSSSEEPAAVEDVRGGIQDLQAPLVTKDGFLEQHNAYDPPLLRRVFSTRDDAEWLQMRGSVVCIGVEMRFEFGPNAVYYYTGTGIVLDTRLVLTVASLFEAPERLKELGQPTVRIHITTDTAPNPNELVHGRNANSVRAYLAAWGPGVDPDELVLPNKFFSRPNTDIEMNLALLKTSKPIPNNHPIFPHYRKKGPKSIQLCTYNQLPVFLKEDGSSSQPPCDCGEEIVQSTNSLSSSTQSSLAQFTKSETNLSETGQNKRPSTAPENAGSTEGLTASLVRFSTHIRRKPSVRPRARRASGSDSGFSSPTHTPSTPIPHSILHEIHALYAPDAKPTLPALAHCMQQLHPGKFTVASTPLWKGVKYKPYPHLIEGTSIRERKIADCRKVTSDFYSTCICYRISTLGGSAGGALCIDGKWVGMHLGQVRYLEVEEGKEVQRVNEHSCGIGLWLDSRKASQWLRINVPLYCEVKKRPRWVQFGM